jgi:DNA-binding beta-propeller fold protein YncE
MSSRNHAKTPTTRTASAPSAIAAGALATLARLLRARGSGARSPRLVLGAVAAALATAALFAPAASADSQICEAGSESGQCSEPSGVAVDRTEGLLYVADKGNNRVDVFDAESGAFLRAFGWGVVASGPDDNPRNEVQTVTVSATGGDFKLEFSTASGSDKTAAIPYNATAAEVQSKLEALGEIGSGNVAVTGSDGGPWAVEFVGARADEDVAEMTITDSTLSGGSGASVATTTPGANYEVCVQSEGDVCRAGQPGSADGQLSGPLGIAVDNDSGSAAFGDVYVYDGANPRVQRFHPDGEFVGKWGSSGNGAGQFESIRGIGVNPSGEVYVLDTWALASGCAEAGGKFEKRVQRFTPAGAVEANYKLTDARCGQVEALAVGSSGELYVANADSSGAVREYAAGASSSSVQFNESTQIAGLGTGAGGEAFVADTSGEGEPLGPEHVAVYTPAGEQTSAIYGDALRPLSALAPFSGPLGGLFAVSREGGVFAIATPPPGPVVLPATTRASGIDAPSATLHAQLNPEGRSTTYRFEYVDDANFATGGFSAATSTPQSGPVGSDFAPHAVSAPIGGLTRNTHYHMRLVAEDDLGHVTLGPESTFSTFGLARFHVSFEDSAGEPVTQAGSHPEAVDTSFEWNNINNTVEQAVKDIIATLPPGFIGNPTAVPTCDSADFLEGKTGCPDGSVLGYATATLATIKGGEGSHVVAPAYNLAPPPGVAAKLGFWVINVPITVEFTTSSAPPYNVIGALTNVSQVVEVTTGSLHVWGVPADESHDALRGRCLGATEGGEPISTGEECEAGVSAVPFVTMPRSCTGPLRTEYATDSWKHPGARLPDGRPDLSDPNWIAGSDQTVDSAGNPLGLSGCGRLGFAPETSAKPTSRAASSASGLDFAIDVHNEGIENPGGISEADIEKTVVTLPPGMTANPSSANGLETCSEAQFAKESPYVSPGEGPTYAPPGVACPEASKLGTIEVETPVLKDTLLKGSLYLATPYANPEGTLIALYMVIKEPNLGLIFKVPLKVEPDPQTGQLVTTGENLPPYPFSHFRLHFREGARSPLVTPPSCGSHTVKAMLYPSSGGAPLESDSSFEIITGPNGGACPSGASFNPGFEAGTRNNAAGAYSPFDMRITRQDGEGDLSRFSAILPPGVVGKIAGIPWCPEAGIARAASRTGEHGGQEELDDPSCPAASQIGRTEAGAGVGSILTYVGGSLYLAGPYHGDPLSVVSITPAVAGPFDAGVVVVREALNLNPITAEVQVDGAASDPIPHILKGIPLSLRDLRVYAERPGFTLNATSCEPSLTRATLWGAGTVLAPSGETPVGAAARYQAASCASLGFKPKLGIKLKGGTKRGAHPALRAVVTPRPGQANFARAVVTLPHSAFLDQAHIRTVCTRVQFAAGAGHGAACPPGSVYGQAKAWTPLLAQPLAGPVYLRSSNNKLPDLIVALHGQFDLELGARIDSKKGGIRTAFTPIPDAPVSRFILNMRGGKKGLIVNSRNLCHKPKQNKAKANIVGQNGRKVTLKPVVRAVKCKNPHRHKQTKHAKKKGKGKKR